MVPASGAAPRWAEGARPGLGRGLMSKWKCRVEPEGTLRGHFLPSSGWENETEKRQPPGPCSPWQHSRPGWEGVRLCPGLRSFAGLLTGRPQAPRSGGRHCPGLLGASTRPHPAAQTKEDPGPAWRSRDAVSRESLGRSSEGKATLALTEDQPEWRAGVQAGPGHRGWSD